MIKLEDNYSIEPDQYSWVLQKEVVKTREKLDKNRKKTGETEEYVDYDKWWFPTLRQCVRRYMNETLKEEKTMLDILNKLNKIEGVLKLFPKIFVKDGELIQV